RRPGGATAFVPTVNRYLVGFLFRRGVAITSAMRTLLLLGFAFVPSLAAAQQPLIVNPTVPLPPVAAPQAMPPAPAAPADNGLTIPDLGGVTITPRLAPSPPPDALPPDRRQERVPSLRLRVPL